jgi:putative transposase
MKAYKFKIRRPSKRIIAQFEQALDICREIYNAALQERRDAWRIRRKHIGYYDQSAEITEVRALRKDVGALHNTVCRDPLQRIDRAFKAFFRRCKSGESPGYPRFKNKARYNSFTYSWEEGMRLKSDRLTLSKIGHVRIRLSREIEGEIKTCTIRRQVDGWFVIGGKNRNKARILVGKRHLKITNQRRDFFHKTSNQLIREFDNVAVEELNIAGMIKNRSLAKSISDAAWNTFLQILTFKAESAGRRVWKVPAAFTSQDCSRCGNRVKKSLSQREHRCVGCGLILHRDHNAAINILGRADRFPRVNAVTQ